MSTRWCKVHPPHLFRSPLFHRLWGINVSGKDGATFRYSVPLFRFLVSNSFLVLFTLVSRRVRCITGYIRWRPFQKFYVSFHFCFDVGRSGNLERRCEFLRIGPLNPLWSRFRNTLRRPSQYMYGVSSTTAVHFSRTIVEGDGLNFGDKARRERGATKYCGERKG